MFTGIVTDIGCVEDIQSLKQGVRFNISTHYDMESLEIGASIACSGICLTIVERGSKQKAKTNWFAVEAWEEALRLTNLAQWTKGTFVNLERSLRLGDEMGGHLVSGHIDGLAEIIDQKKEGDAVRFFLQVPTKFTPFIVNKGSIALNGTSLTVNCVKDRIFDVLIIRHTLEMTTWGQANIGDRVNLEIDQLARYAAKLSGFKVKDE
ncbi:riboflavin synthase [Bartonella quintana]|uniref:Riboflavin synthase n=8 Tax=Bartonella quintana TaxID=803 RepID=A0A0H3M0D7_BARQU|nr:riboflavin synthase [Bartonella quintana]ETS11567.1 riboflavin synthase, alpha subunit [Bartonella quintana BQ2-D70]ETS14373.1 riboflavin synthase, alpha subunit [Bartonella quintana JK 73rel]ETS16060.1 riboflavin synthase, alpha subunit [Bartonella quintana JK 73]ETS18062.1 riboflavin synthase, alpha subunit [Bartonella quintana JK 7]ETS18891.1 riboflavin synthase, alpha subunit [Bartonella quintana JK 12]